MSEETRQAGPDLDADIQEAIFGPVGRTEPKPFSTDMLAAMELLETLHKAAWFWRLDSVMGGYICTLQRIVGDLKKPNPERKTIQVGAATIPLAISLAAVRINGQEKGVKA